MNANKIYSKANFLNPLSTKHFLGVDCTKSKGGYYAPTAASLVMLPRVAVAGVYTAGAALATYSVATGSSAALYAAVFGVLLGTAGVGLAVLALIAYFMQNAFSR